MMEGVNSTMIIVRTFANTTTIKCTTIKINKLIINSDDKVENLEDGKNRILCEATWAMNGCQSVFKN
jgi:hypothetical protein